MAYNSATKAIEEAYKKVKKDKKTSTGLNIIPLSTYTSGILSTPPGMSAIVAPNGLSKLSESDAKKLARLIDKLYVGADHLNVKANLTWKSMYQVQAHDVYRMDTLGAIADHNMEAVPCHNCGIIVPYSDIQIDHYMPQVGGNFILKIFRALGLTKAISTGAKGVAQAGGGLSGLVMNPKGRDPGDYDHLVNATPQDKWSTNDKGDIFLSLFSYVGATSDLERFCKNSLLNLSPLCPTCNRVKSDWVRPIA